MGSGGSCGQSAGLTNRKRIEATHRGEMAKIIKARYLHGTVRRRSDRHKRERECAIPGEIWRCAAVLRRSRGVRRHRQKSAEAIVCAEQRVDQEGSSPSDAQMRSVISKSGGNASLAGEGSRLTGRQGARREARSEGHEEKYRAVVDGGCPEDEPVGQRWGKVEPALWRRRRSHSPTAPRCLRTARYGRATRDLRRTGAVRGWHRDQRAYKREVKGRAMLRQ